ncbi:MAG TPA: hypothetical protein DHV62_07725 [Elusimicrobia bacterium]|nr:hypothetical protein [Elusimicrobiota bacterium]
MKKGVGQFIVFILIFCFFAIPLPYYPTNSLIHQFTNSLIYAEVNLLEPLRPGIEGQIPEKTTAIILEGLGFNLADNYWELPFLLAFRPTTDYEFGARVSIRAIKPVNKWTNGITDTLIAGKYIFFRESIAYPTIFAEA